MLLVVLISNLFNVSISQFEGFNWYMEEPEAYTELIRLGLNDMNMFHSSIMLHNQSLHSFNMKSGVDIGGTMGTLDLGEKNEDFNLQRFITVIFIDKTRMPSGSYFQGLLIVALDPLNRIEDVDRTDNIFVQYVRMENQVAATEYSPDCSMYPSASVPGIPISSSNLMSN